MPSVSADFPCLISFIACFISFVQPRMSVGDQHQDIHDRASEIHAFTTVSADNTVRFSVFLDLSEFSFLFDSKNVC